MDFDTIHLASQQESMCEAYDRKLTVKVYDFGSALSREMTLKQGIA